jgi:hypothetical protein
VGAPNFQVFTGIKLQFPAGVTSSWNINFWAELAAAKVRRSVFASAAHLPVLIACGSLLGRPIPI